jgi:hypothetical protein
MPFESNLTFRTPAVELLRVIEDANEPLKSTKTAKQRWLSRLAFSFVIIAAYLLWQAFHVNRQASSVPPNVRFVLYLVGAFASTVLAMLGLRERHRRSNDEV